MTNNAPATAVLLRTLSLVTAFASLAACARKLEPSTASVGPGGPVMNGNMLGNLGSASPDGSTTAGPLQLMPAAAVVVIDGTGPKSVQFTLTAVDDNGNAKAVTPDAIEFDRPDLATVMGGDPVVATAPAAASTTPYGGTGTIYAIYGGAEATATLTVQVKLTQFASGLSTSTPAVTALGAGTLAADPAPNVSALLYPYDRTVWPLGLTAPLVMWNAPQTMDVYRLSYSEKNFSVDSYSTLTSLPAQMRLDQATWDRLTNSNDSLHGGTDPITFSLSRWDGASHMAYATATETWSVSPESLRGTIYYWSASDDNGVRVGHISRFQPGVGSAPQVLNNGTCMGCHAVNANGTVLVGDIDDGLEADGTTRPTGQGVPSVAPYVNWSGTRPWASFDITQPNFPVTYQSNMFGADVALTPDGKLLVFGGPTTQPGSKYLSLGDPKTGQVIATSGLDNIVLDGGVTSLMMPAFSPDGTMLALVESTEAGNPGDNVLPGQPESIVYLKFDEGSQTFDPSLHTITTGSAAAFSASGPGLGYPSFTPDSAAIAFHAGTKPTGCNATCDDTSPDDGDLFVASLGGGDPVRLAAADDPPDPNDHSASVEPTFNPVKRGGYSWAVFTSMRAWGNQPWPASVTATGHVNGKRRLWVTPLDATIGTADPSHPAIYLEGQENAPNMRGFWTLGPCIATTVFSSPDGGTSSSSAGTAGGGGDAEGVPGTCTDGFECCSGFCENSACVEPAHLACVGLGGACALSSDCCNAQVVQCLNGKCAIPAPK
jgi:hypothetical protein